MKYGPSFVVELLQRHMGAGMDEREAIEEVGLEAVREACWDESGSPEDRWTILEILAVRSRMEADDQDMVQALDLTEAGWVAIDPRDPTLPPPKDIWSKTAVMSWYWRRPPRRKGKPGRLFLSTNQAWRAMQREKSAD